MTSEAPKKPTPVTDEMIAKGVEAWDQNKYTYRSTAELVRKILEAALG